MNHIPIFFHSVRTDRPSPPFLKTNEKTRSFSRRAIFKYLHTSYYNAKYQRNNSEIPKSTTAKNTAAATTVASTITVYLESSLRLGQLTFLISLITFLKNPPTLAI